jgi:hypothetical protein
MFQRSKSKRTREVEKGGKCDANPVALGPTQCEPWGLVVVLASALHTYLYITSHTYYRTQTRGPRVSSISKEKRKKRGPNLPERPGTRKWL